MQYLAAQFERVNFLSLLAQSLIHATQMVTHHAELVLIAPLRCSKLILWETLQLEFACFRICREAIVYIYNYSVDRKLLRTLPASV